MWYSSTYALAFYVLFLAVRFLTCCNICFCPQMFAIVMDAANMNSIFLCWLLFFMDFSHCVYISTHPRTHTPLARTRALSSPWFPKRSNIEKRTIRIRNVSSAESCKQYILLRRIETEFNIFVSIASPLHINTHNNFMQPGSSNQPNIPEHRTKRAGQNTTATKMPAAPATTTNIKNKNKPQAKYSASLVLLNMSWFTFKTHTYDSIIRYHFIAQYDRFSDRFWFGSINERYGFVLCPEPYTTSYAQYNARATTTIAKNSNENKLNQRAEQQRDFHPKAKWEDKRVSWITGRVKCANKKQKVYKHKQQQLEKMKWASYQKCNSNLGGQFSVFPERCLSIFC